MDRKINGHNVEYQKRLAKKIKKESGITHAQALYQVAVNLGYTNWKNFINQGEPAVKKKRQRIITKPQAPVPSTIQYHYFPAKNSERKPNAIMPIENHRELGALLNEIRNTAEDHKRVRSPIDSVRSSLDNWVASEYEDRKVLPDEVFFQLYYGDPIAKADHAPTDERNQRLIALCRKVKVILGQHYHDCGPLRELYKKLDLAIKWINVWPKDRSSKGITVIKRPIPAGTFIRLKESKYPAIMIRHDGRKDTVEGYSDQGPFLRARDEIMVSQDQSQAKIFRPLRLLLPYGKWTCANGTEVLFNRDYCPIWTRDKQGKVSAIDPDTRIEYKKQDYYYNDKTAPWGSGYKKKEECLQILKDWGVADKTSNLMKLFPAAIAANDMDMLGPYNTEKRFAG